MAKRWGSLLGTETKDKPKSRVVLVQWGGTCNRRSEALWVLPRQSQTTRLSIFAHFRIVFLSLCGAASATSCTPSQQNSAWSLKAQRSIHIGALHNDYGFVSNRRRCLMPAATTSCLVSSFFCCFLRYGIPGMPKKAQLSSRECGQGGVA